MLVADSDLTALSRIYLCFLHQDFKVEACNDALEIGQRVKRFKPGVVVVRSAMDGLEEGLFSQLAAIPLPVVVLHDGDPFDYCYSNITIVPSGIELQALVKRVRELTKVSRKGK